MEITHLILWYLVMGALGWLGFPLAYRLLPGLKDRGYSIARTLGLLLWGYVFWLLASLGIVQNTSAGLLFAAALVGLLCLWALLGITPQELRAWLRSQRMMILVVEALFLLAFAGWAWIRATNPEALGTEKPMELAFINAILGSPTFPPHDPWLSGYAISYYYFGYVLVAMLAKTAGTSGAVAFNLGISLVFALTAIGAYGLVFNLLNARTYERTGRHDLGAPHYTLAALLAPLFTLIISNLEGFLHLLHTQGWFWHQGTDGAITSGFWRWLDIIDLNQPPVLPPESLTPTRFWWWWRASRVVQDYDLAGNAKEIINEFPFFSYLLADVHPHVLAMPFAMLVMNLALNLFMGASRSQVGWPRLRFSRASLSSLGVLSVIAGALVTGLGVFRVMHVYSALNGAGGVMAAASAGGASGLLLTLVGMIFVFGGGIVLIEQKSGHTGAAGAAFGHPISHQQTVIDWAAPLYLDPAFTLLAAVALGGMAFLNTWDFPVYVALTALAYALGRVVHSGGTFKSAVKDFILLGLLLGVGGGLLFLPFYLGFSSQAGGALPNLIYPTRGAHLWVMFAPLFLPIGAWLAYLTARAADRRMFLKGLGLALALISGLWVLSLLFASMIIALPEAGRLFLSSLAAEDAGQLFRTAVQRRLLYTGGWLTLLALLAPGLSLLMGIFKPQKRSSTAEQGANQAITRHQRHLEFAEIFALLLALVGTLLVLGPEFFFLRDLFGWRMNTIFKFYFQAWQIWSIAAAYGSIVLLARLRGAVRFGFGLGLILLLAMGLVYPILSLDSKTNGFNATGRTLDSSAYLARQSPDEMAAIQWLRTAPVGVIAEAVPPRGGSYTEYARFATLSGLPGLLGWVGHENQWRGESSSEALGTRQSDLEKLYCTRTWSEASAILDRYNIRYIVIGNLERNNYVPGLENCPHGLEESKFQRSLTPVFQSGNVVIYEYMGEGNE